MKRKSLLIMLLAALFMPLALHAQQSLPYSCGFESGDDLSGWLIQGGPENAGIYSAYPHEGERHWGFNYEDPDCYLVSPIFTGGDNGIVVSFYYESYSASYPDCFKVGYTTDESITDASQFTYDETICEETGAWTQYNQTFPAGTKRIAVMYLNNNGNGWYLWLDDFEFTVPGAAVCNRPTGLTATNVGSRTATISWTSDASAWQICVNDDEAHLINVNQTSYTLSGLTPDTEYTVKVRTNCGNNNFSAWTNVSFTTEVACPAPEVTIADITSTSANITWTGSANNYNLRYRNLTFFDDFESNELTGWTIYTEGEVGEGLEGWRIIDPTGGLSWTGHNGSTYVASAWSWSTDAYHANNWLITPQVQLGGILKFYVYTNQSYPDDYEVLLSTSGNAIDNFTVTLQAMASVPTTGDWVEVSIDLNAYAGQTGYIALHHQYYDGNYILVDDFGIFNRTWTTANGVTSPYAISGLTPETTYEVEVQAVCGGQDGSSEWAQTTFTTLPSCVAPARLTITDITTNSAVVTWTGSANSYNLKVNDQTYNNVTSPYTLSGLTPNTEYTVEVQSVCSASSTSTWSTSVFWTACEAFNLPYSYNFDNDNELNCWSLISANNNMLGITTVDNNNVFIFSSYNSASSYDQYLISPELNGTAGVGIDVEFKYRSYDGRGSGETFKVGYSTTTNDISAFTWGDEISTLSTDWIDYFGEFPAGTKYVAVYYYADYQYYFLVDDFNFDVHSNCRKPTDLTVTDFTATSANLTWTENGDATSWVVSYTVGATGRERTINATTNQATIPNLTPGTSFIAKVRPVCDVNNKWSEDITFTIPNNLFINDGNWNVGSNWYNGAVPADSSNVGIIANAIVPANYLAIAGDVIISDAGSITVADGGQLVHNTFGLEVTMQKYVPAYTSSQDNYKLVAFPFIDDELEVPAGMTLVANDFYLFDNSQAGEEWQNNKENAITNVELYKGYLYANPTATTVSMTGTTYNTPKYSYGHPQDLYYDDTENEVNGWYLLGNPYTSNAYIYGATDSLFAMEVMYYDANGNMQTIVGGPVPPMQGFFVKITEDTEVWFLASEYDLSSKTALHAINDKKASQDVNLDKKADKNVTILDKTMVKKLAKNAACARFKNEVKPFKPIKK